MEELQSGFPDIRPIHTRSIRADGSQIRHPRLAIDGRRYAKIDELALSFDR